MIELMRTTSSNPDFAWLVAHLDQELWERYPDLQHLYAPLDKITNNNNVIVAYHHKKPVGCGCFNIYDSQTIEIKRMFVEPAHRSKGIAGSILAELEDWAQELNFSRILIETGFLQPEALHLYKKSGYTIVGNYGPYADMDTSVCMEKVLSD